MPRRAFLRLGLGGLTLPQLFRQRAAAATGGAGERTALIVVWLQGGASHLETYDPKPQAPAEIRGPYGAVATRVPGTRVSELLPLHARVADKFTLLRSLVHSGFCHQQGNQQVLTGHPVTELKLTPEHPDLLSVTHRLRSDASRVMPGYVALQQVPYVGAAYLGAAHEAFDVTGDPDLPGFEVPDLTLKNAASVERLKGQVSLRQRLDALSRAADGRHHGQEFDRFQEQAWSMLTSPEVVRAFDVGREDPRVRDRYGRNTWGQRCLLARRLVEAGVDLVTTSLHGPLCGRVGNWDDHAVNHHIFEAMKSRCRYFDRAVAALVEDLFDRGLGRRVMVMVTGEFGRTPRITYQPDSASGVTQPGRDHWPRATSLLFAGGGIAGGEVVGATDRQGGDVTDRRVGVRDVLATLYRHLGIDAGRLTLTDPAGRPVPVLPEGTPIPELVARG
jgi:uncharacterized protein (DUF1501 family)